MIVDTGLCIGILILDSSVLFKCERILKKTKDNIGVYIFGWSFLKENYYDMTHDLMVWNGSQRNKKSLPCLAKTFSICVSPITLVSKIGPFQYSLHLLPCKKYYVDCGGNLSLRSSKVFLDAWMVVSSAKRTHSAFVLQIGSRPREC